MINTEFFQLRDAHPSGSYNALTHVIKGCNVYIHKMSENLEINKLDRGELSVFFVVEGSVSCCDQLLKTYTTYIPSASERLSFVSESATLLEIRLKLDPSEVKMTEEKLPLKIEYGQARAYKEDCKSEKTTSRMILEDGIIPRFALGSVETDGPDKVEEHEHPSVDQFFFSLPHTESYLTVSGERLAFPEKTAMHIPLGSSHGVVVEDGSKMHYLWCDFYLDESTSDYIRSAHKFI